GVTSAVVRVDMHPRFQELQVERTAFMRFLQLCFRQKRKTLVNNLKGAGFAETTNIVAAIEKAGLSLNVRAEAVSLEAMASIYRRLQAEQA
ncbi:MAG: ribosomal RNA small subunit methyltransferase A, partial [Acidobacteriaceae bacterium]